ncbi:MAG: FkbM family methyltransferase [Solirubrobacterales bacterium]|nr:FkbM family methyltransferase [Solirubrobacterales bacterium]
MRVRQPWRYLLSEAQGPAKARCYALRNSGIQVLLRHGSGDIITFDEVFCSAAYEPPPAVVSALRDLGRPPRVLDLGANVGLYSAFALGRWPGATITALEPDAENLMLLRASAILNRSHGDIQVVDAAAAASAGTMRFVVGLNAESHKAHPDEGAASDVVRTVDAFEHITRADLVKVDIEGGEWELLRDPRLASAFETFQALVLEHHGRHCPTHDPRTTATQLLTTAGFDVHPQGAIVGGVGMLWAARCSQTKHAPAGSR